MRLLAIASLLFFSHFTHATIVQVSTDYGDISINLYDVDTPKTVENFLRYVEAERYDGIIIHRSIPEFVMQTGGYTVVDNPEGNDTVQTIDTYSSVVNEPVFSSVFGTIAMAKLASSPNSATSQWFINLSDNSANLDIQNGGFTVFGSVTADANSQTTLDTLVAFSRYNFGGAFTSLPLDDSYTTSDAQSGIFPTKEQYITINSVSIIDDTVDTASSLEKPENTLIHSLGSDSAGSLHFIGFMMLLSLVSIRRSR